MKYYLKNAFLPFMYTIFCSMIAIGVFSIESKPFGFILLALNFAVYIFVLAVVGFKGGEQAYKVMLTNDMERREIIRTGKDRPINEKEEYSPVKGFMLGFVPCIPLLVLMFIQFLISIFGGSYEGLSAIGSLIYKVVYAFFEYAEIFTKGYGKFICLLIVPVIIISTYVSYELGAKKERKVQEKIKESKKYIYGE